MRKEQKTAFGKRFKEAREREGLTQEQLGKSLHVLKQAVSHWERGRWLPEPAQLTAAARRLGVSTDWLLTGVELPSGVNSGRLRFPGKVIARLTLPQLLEFAKGQLKLEDVQQQRISQADGVAGDLASFDITDVSMETPSGEGLKPGTIVTVDTSKRPEPGEIAVVALLASNEVLVRRFRPGAQRGTYVLKADNPDYGEREITKQDRARIIGTLVERVQLGSR